MIHIRVPATSANLGPGFDTLGMALPIFLDIYAETIDKGLDVRFSGEGHRELAAQLNNNLIARSMNFTLDMLGYRLGGLRAFINNQIPLTRGLGSSSAAIAAGVLLGNEIAGGQMDMQQILNTCTHIETHPDNVVPALVGGFTVSVMEGNNVFYRRIEPPAGLNVVVAVPDFDLPTEVSRAVRPAQYESKDVVYNLQRACFLVASLATGNLDKLSIAMKDAVHQPFRQTLIPGFDNVISGAMESGALGVALSGAGPSVIAFTAAESDPVGQAMLQGFARAGISARIIKGKPCLEGAVVYKE